MSIICLDCGNTGKFKRRYALTEYASETAILNGKTEEELDYEDYDIADSERGDYYPIECIKCKSQNCKDELGEEGILNARWKHTDKEGKWHKEELPEELRNKRIRNMLLAKSV